MYCYLHCILFSIHKKARVTTSWHISFWLIQSALHVVSASLCFILFQLHLPFSPYDRRKAAYPMRDSCAMDVQQQQQQKLKHHCIIICCVEAKTFKSTFILQQWHSTYTYTVQAVLRSSFRKYGKPYGVCAQWWCIHNVNVVVNKLMIFSSSVVHIFSEMFYASATWCSSKFIERSDTIVECSSNCIAGEK